jgi:uncharacterized RDD family membrane protein YckC
MILKVVTPVLFWLAIIVTFVAIVASFYILFHLKDANPDRSLAILIAAGAFIVQVGTTLLKRDK